jgi:prepilin-type N-terminal cleavage/methylation domain-containing protein
MLLGYAKSMFPLRRGFTIVELLIVIVVIGILAGITIATFNGAQKKAKVSSAQSELSNFIKRAELFKIDDSMGAYPSNLATFKQILIDTNLWNSTRDGNVKTYAYCSTGTNYSMVSVQYIETLVDGTKLYYASKDGLKSFTYDNSVAGAFTIDKICTQTLPGSTYSGWAHQVT